jgi:hypothetical protein
MSEDAIYVDDSSSENEQEKKKINLKKVIVIIIIVIMVKFLKSTLKKKYICIFIRRRDKRIQATQHLNFNGNINFMKTNAKLKKKKKETCESRTNGGQTEQINVAE